MNYVTAEFAGQSIGLNVPQPNDCSFDRDIAELWSVGQLDGLPPDHPIQGLLVFPLAGLVTLPDGTVSDGVIGWGWEIRLPPITPLRLAFSWRSLCDWMIMLPYFNALVIHAGRQETPRYRTGGLTLNGQLFDHLQAKTRTYLTSLMGIDPESVAPLIDGGVGDYQ